MLKLKYMNETALAAAKVVSAVLAERGVRHALCGGLAVEFHGYHRMTDNVNFAVGEQAFENHSDGMVTLKVPIVRVGDIAVTFIKAEFEISIHDMDGLPVVTLPPLIVMKLRAGRQRDIADLAELVKCDAVYLEQARGHSITIPEDLCERWETVLWYGQQLKK